MSPEAFEKRPYLDWSLDRWKTSIILLVFGGLVISSLVGPATDLAGSPAETSTAPAGAPTARVLAGADEPQARTGVASLQPVADEATAVPTPTPGPSAAAADGAAGSQPTPIATLAAASAFTATAAVATPDGSPAPPSLPLTLANISPNAIVPAHSIRVLYGTAAPGSLVEVRDQATGPVAATDLSPGVTEEVVLGSTAADGDGLWQLGPFTPLPPGQHVLTVYQLGAAGSIQVAGSPVVVTVLEIGKQGPLSLATPSIKFPTLGARLRSGQATFVGAGLPGMMVRLYLDNRQVAEGLVTTREEWRLTPEEVLTPGVHVARVAALNPDGAIIAESAPVVFWVEEEPAAHQRLPAPTPALPLTISGLAYGDRRQESLVVRGRATPHTGISAWVNGEPIRFANALTDGGWQFWLFEDEAPVVDETVEIRSSLGERLVTEVYPLEASAVVLSYAPEILSPLTGDVLTTRRPLLVGMAQPSSEVAVLVNRSLVARVLADRQGMWAYQLTEPLPPGYSTIVAQVEATWTTPGLTSRTVVVTLAPRL